MPREIPKIIFSFEVSRGADEYQRLKSGEDLLVINF